MWKCLYLPWHKLKVNIRYETGGKQIKCSCGKLYAMLDRTKTFVEWDDSFEEFYKSININPTPLN